MPRGVWPCYENLKASAGRSAPQTSNHRASYYTNKETIMHWRTNRPVPGSRRQAIPEGQKSISM